MDMVGDTAGDTAGDMAVAMVVATVATAAMVDGDPMVGTKGTGIEGC